MNASIGFWILDSGFWILGTIGLFGATNAQCTLLPGCSFAGAFAPSSIHRRASAICASDNGGFLYGIRVMSLCVPEMTCTSRLSEDLPGWMAGPFWPPFSAKAAVSSRRPCLGCVAPWHW